MDSIDKYSYMKKGVQYSHYTGTARQNIVDYTWLAEHEEDETKRAEYLKEVQRFATELMQIISHLDHINEMTL